jgi:hypothetical protein
MRPGTQERLPGYGVVAGEHVSDRLGEAAADLERVDLGPRLVAVSGLHSSRTLSEGDACGSIAGGFEERPAHVIGRSSQSAALVALAALIDACA